MSDEAVGRVEGDPTARRDAAIRASIDREPTRAGELYTLAARGTLAGLECEAAGHATLGDGYGRAGYGLGYLLLAGASYRAAGADTRATTRATEGIAVATDYRDAVVREPVERAVCEEFRGAFGVVGGLDTGGFDRAGSLYADCDVEDPVSVATRPFPEGLRKAAQQIARHTPGQFAWDSLHGDADAGSDYLATRPRVLARKLPRALEAVAEAGYVAPPRATTEHNNADWRCPDCGQSETHWVADEIICLDCDVRMVEK
ncbi:MAG: hypothetical protein ABEI75_00450 [Halobaculum sp.]